MDSIYSRKRINIPKIKGFYTKNNNKNKKILTVCVIVCISVLTFYSILKSIDPIFDGLCIQKAKTIATEIVNAQSSVALDNIDYKDIVSVVKDEANNTNINCLRCSFRNRKRAPEPKKRRNTYSNWGINW